MDAPAYAPQHPAHGPAPAFRWPRWLLAVIVFWAVVLLVLTWLSVRGDQPTVREQRDIAQAAPVVDRAAGELVAAAGTDTPLELAPPRLSRGCRITPWRHGGTLVRTVTARTAPGREKALLDGVAQRLPASYQASVWVDGGQPRLDADAGQFVVVRGRVASSGVVELSAGTGCRPVPDGYTQRTGPELGPQVEQEASRVVSALGGPLPNDPVETGVPCPSGGVAGTLRFEGVAERAGNLAAALRPLAGTTVVTDTPEAYAYRSGSLMVTVTRAGDATRVALTQGCTR